jgi:hypothetical protein
MIEDSTHAPPRSTTPARSAPPNAGALQLAALRLSSRKLGARLGVAHTTAARWRSEPPSAEHRELLREQLGIAIDSWDRSADPSAATASGAEAPEHDASALVRLREQVKRLAAARAQPDLSVTAMLELEKLELAASRAIARLEGAVLTEHQITNAPAFRRMLEAISSSLAPFGPEPLGAVAGALEELTASG